MEKEGKKEGKGWICSSSSHSEGSSSLEIFNPSLLQLPTPWMLLPGIAGPGGSDPVLGSGLGSDAQGRIPKAG